MQLASYTRPCVVCNQNHNLFQCDTFKSMPPKARFEIVKKNRLCYNCLLFGRNSYNCHKKSVCSVSGCGKKHTRFIHFDGSVSEQRTDSVSQFDTGANEGNHVSVSNVGMNVDLCSTVCLPIISVLIEGDVEVFALLDTGSTSTFISQRLASRLGLKGTLENYKINTLGRSVNASSEVVSFNISGIDKEHTLNLNNVFVVSSIPARYSGSKIDLRDYPYLEGLPIRQVNKDVVTDILIGMDNAHLLMPLEVKFNPSCRNQPYATKTVLGWALSGPICAKSEHEVTSNFISLEQQVSSLWEMEFSDEETLSYSVEDRIVLEFWGDEIQHVKGHYVLPIPWREGRPSFPNNRAMALGRLKNLLSRLQKIGLFQKYQENIHKMITDGYAEPVPQNELSLSVVLSSPCSNHRI